VTEATCFLDGVSIVLVSVTFASVGSMGSSPVETERAAEGCKPALLGDEEP
jgi:hypothetical protein